MTIRPPQRILTEILLRRDRLTKAIRTGIDHSFTAAETGCAGRPGEVDRLVYFFLEGLPAIEGQFNQILLGSGVKATLSGIFCHQTPRCTPIPPSPSSPPGCELGDILFLVTYGGRLYSHYLGNAMLVQAKENAVSVGGTTQAFLYERAREFSYTAPGQLAGNVRSLRDSSYALWYWGFLRHHWRPGWEWSSEGIVARPIAAHRAMRPFEVALMDLICGVSGRRVKALDPGDPEEGWSRIVDDLIRVTARSAFRRQNAYVSRDKEPLRGEEVSRVLHDMAGSQECPNLVRCSLGRIFEFFDKELAEIGQKLTSNSESFDREVFLRDFPERKMDSDSNEVPPILGNKRPEGPEDGSGSSFVIMDFESKHRRRN